MQESKAPMIGQSSNAKGQLQGICWHTPCIWRQCTTTGQCMTNVVMPFAHCCNGFMTSLHTVRNSLARRQSKSASNCQNNSCQFTVHCLLRHWQNAYGHGRCHPNFMCFNMCWGFKHLSIQGIAGAMQIRICKSS